MRKTTLLTAGLLILGIPAMAQEAVIVQTGDTDQVTTTTTNGQQTTVMTNADGQRITVTINNESVAFEEARQPVMMAGRVMVPLRGVTERLGGNVLYEASTKVITGAHAGTGNQFRLRVGTPEALLNGKQMNLDAPPRVINGTTYVPLRFISEAFGAKVAWEPSRRAVVIDVMGNTTTVTTEATP